MAKVVEALTAVPKEIGEPSGSDLVKTNPVS